MTDMFPQVTQAVAGDDYTVYAYMNDGSVRFIDMRPLIRKGGVFAALGDPEVFRRGLTVLNDTVAWDLRGGRGPADCIDLDPFSIWERPAVADPLAEQPG